jgi:hypothetical protein
MKFLSRITITLAMSLFSLSMAFCQDKSIDPSGPQSLSEREFSDLQQAIKSGDQEAVNAISERHADRERHRKHGRNHDELRPDQEPGEGESVVTPDDADTDEIAPVEGREEREARRRRHHEEQERHRLELERQQRDREEYERLHPKPVEPTGVIGFLWSWVVWPVLGSIAAPFMWFFSLSKWVIIIALLVLAVMIVTAVVFFGSVALSVCSWLWRRTSRIWTKSNS